MWYKVHAAPGNARGLKGIHIVVDACNIPKQLLKPRRPRLIVVRIDVIIIISLYRYKYNETFLSGYLKIRTSA